MSQAQNETTIAPAHTEQALYGLFAIWDKKNHHTAIYFAISIAGIIGIFIISHWTQKLLGRTSTTAQLTFRTWSLPLQRLCRTRVLLWIPTSPLKALLVLVYIAINIALTFHDRPDKAPMITILARRFGWLTLCNICLTIFLGLKNTPLSPLAGYSFDSLNVLHRCTGYTVLIFTILHAVIYIVGLEKANALYVLKVPEQYAAIVAALALLCLFVTAIGPVRRRTYEVFYASHQILAATTLVAVGLHRPDLAGKALIVTVLTASLWVADQSLRVSRWFYYGFGNHAILTALPNGATRVTMHRSMKRAQPGSHAFVWIPGVKALQRHPFTLVGTGPVEFVIKARDGFSKRLHEKAQEFPNVKFRASIDGPYGQVPDSSAYGKVVLIAGGSGATFPIALALDWSRRSRQSEGRQTLDLIWVVRHAESLQWFTNELAELQADPRVSISLFVTSPAHGRREIRGKSYDSTFLSSMSPTSPTITIPEKTYDSSFLGMSPTSPSVLDSEKSWSDKHISLRASIATNTSGMTLRAMTGYGRPDMTLLLGKAIEGLTESEKVLVAACGPGNMLGKVKEAVRAVEDVGAPIMESHFEEFSY